MGYDPETADVIHLLKKLREASSPYPPEMLSMRRQGYLRQVAAISGGAGLALGIKQITKGAGTPPAAGNILEILLIAAILVEAGAAVYFYRAKLTEMFRSVTVPIRHEEISNPPIISSPFLEAAVTASLIPAWTDTPVATPSITGTPSLEVAIPPTGQSQQNGSSQAMSTPEPNSSSGNQGNHYGQTPKPQRTKESGKNNQQKTPKQKKN